MAIVGLVFVDGHEDTMPLDVSEDGEAANSELGLLLGITGRLLRGPLRDRLPALRSDALAVLGPRDAAWRRQFNVGSLADQDIWLRSHSDVAADPVEAGRAAVHHVRGDGAAGGGSTSTWTFSTLSSSQPKGCLMSMTNPVA